MSFTQGEYLRAYGTSGYKAESRSRTEMLSDLSMTPGTDVQAYDVILQGVSALDPSASGSIIVWNASSAAWVTFPSYWQTVVAASVSASTHLSLLGISSYLLQIDHTQMLSLTNLPTSPSIGAAAWEHVAAMDQDVATTSSPTFIGVYLADNRAIFFGTGQDADMYYDGTSAYLRTDLQNPSDFILDCGTGKTLKLESTVWDDLRVDPMAGKLAGSSDATLRGFQAGGSGVTFQLYHFEKNNEMFFITQLPHTYKEGTDISVHIHWTPNAQGVTESGNTVGWKIDYSICGIDEAFAASAQLDLSDACNGVNYEHNMTPAATIDGTGLKISDVIVFRVIRTDTGADDTWTGTVANTPALLAVDFHHEIDTMGSRTVSAK